MLDLTKYITDFEQMKKQEKFISELAQIKKK